MSVLPQGQFLLINFFLVYGTYFLSLHISVFEKLDAVSVIMWQLLEIILSPLRGLLLLLFVVLLFSDFLNTMIICHVFFVMRGR